MSTRTHFVLTPLPLLLQPHEPWNTFWFDFINLIEGVIVPTFFSSKDTCLGPSRAVLTLILRVSVATTDREKCAASFHGRCAYKVKRSIRDVVERWTLSASGRKEDGGGTAHQGADRRALKNSSGPEVGLRHCKQSRV